MELTNEEIEYGNKLRREDLLAKMCADLASCKEKENEFKQKRISIEESIAELLVTKSEGTDKATAGEYVITVTSKLTRTLDYEAYLAIEQGLPEGVRCVVLKPELDLKKLRALEMVDPSLPPHFITTKPAKASVKVEAKKEK